MFPFKRDPASSLFQLNAFLVPLIHTIYHHVSSRPRCNVGVGNRKAQHFAPLSSARTSSQAIIHYKVHHHKSSRHLESKTLCTQPRPEPSPGYLSWEWLEEEGCGSPSPAGLLAGAGMPYPDSLNHGSPSSLCLFLPARSKGRRFALFLRRNTSLLLG